MNEPRWRLNVNRAADVTLPDGTTLRGALVIVADHTLVSFSQIVEVLRALMLDYPQRNVALYYKPETEPQPSATIPQPDEALP